MGWERRREKERILDLVSEILEPTSSLGGCGSL